MFDSEGSKFDFIKCAIVVATVTVCLAILYPTIQTGETKKVTVTIVDIYHEDPDEWGCIGTNVKTSVKTKEGFVDQICGSYGKVGDKIAGYWTEGAADHTLNGFKTTK